MLGSLGNKSGSRIILTIVVTTFAKFLGFIRVQQIATMLGISYQADVILLSFQVIWLIETILISGSAVPVLIANIYKKDKESTSDAAAYFFMHSAFWCILLALIYGILLALFSGYVINMLAPALHEDAKILFSEIMLLSVATPMCLAIAHFASLVNRLNDNGVWYSMPQVVTNLIALLGLVLGFYIYGKSAATIGMIGGLMLGAILVICMQLWVMPRDAVKQLWVLFRKVKLRVASYEGATIYWRAVLALLLAVFVQELYIYTDFYFASSGREGGISLISYASRLATLTNMLFVATAFVILEPRWARALADKKSAWSEVIWPESFSLLSMLAAPVAILIFFSADVTSFVYNSRSLELEDSMLLNELTKIYGASVVLLGCSLILVRSLILRDLARWIVYISMATLPVKVLLNYFLVEAYGLVGLASSTVLVLLLQSAAYLTVLRSDDAFQMVAMRAMLSVFILFVFVLFFAFVLKVILPEGVVSLLAASVIILFFNLVLGVILKFSYAEFIKNIRANIVSIF